MSNSKTLAEMLNGMQDSVCKVKSENGWWNSPQQVLCKRIGIRNLDYDTSTNGRLERWIEARFRTSVWNNVMLSEDEYVLIMRDAMTCKTEDDVNELRTRLGSFIFSKTPVEQRWSENVREYADAYYSDIAYFAGYFDFETRLRIERLFGVDHPIAGNFADNGDDNEYLLAKADEWNRMFLHTEAEEIRLKVEDEERKLAELSKALNHHSNKVKRRGKKKLKKEGKET